MNISQSTHLFPLLFLTSFIIAGCVGGQVEPIELSADSATEAIVLTSTPVATLESSGPPEPTPIPSPRADVPLAKEGPWWILSSDKGLWAGNPDGSGLRQLTGPLNLQSNIGDGAAPSGGHLAYITGTDDVRGLTLSLLTLPSGEIRIITPLTSPESEPSLAPGDESSEVAVRAIVAGKSFDWSPDGSSLAFVGVMQGPSSDLYVYSLEEQTIARHTDGPTQAIRPIYDPLGENILHAGVASFGSGAGADMRGFWVGRADGSEFRSLLDPSESGDEIVVGWVDPETFLIFSWHAWGGMRDLRTINTLSGETTILWEECFDDKVALDELTGTILLTVHQGYANCLPDVGPGLYRVSAIDGSTVQIIEDDAILINWSDEAALFFAFTEHGLLAVDRDGNFVDLDVPEGAFGLPSVAPGSRQLAWTGESGVWIGSLTKSLDMQPIQIFDQPSRLADWGPDGSYLLFLSWEGSLHVAQAPDFETVLVAEDLGSSRGGVSLAWIWP